MKRKSQENFEKLVNRLEGIVEELESHQISLEESIKKFEEGVNLAGLCFDRLKKAEEKVKVLTEDSSGKFKFEDFDLK